MTQEKLTITRDELYRPEVDDKLKQQEARACAALHSQAQADADLPLLVRPRRGRFWYNPVLTVAFFGLLGGLSAFTGGEVIIRVMDASKGMRDILRGGSRFQRSGETLQAIRSEEADHAGAARRRG